MSEASGRAGYRQISRYLILGLALGTCLAFADCSGLTSSSSSSSSTSTSGSTDSTSGSTEVADAIPAPAATGVSSIDAGALYKVQNASSSTGATLVFYKVSEIPTTVEVSLTSSKNITNSFGGGVQLFTATLSSNVPITIGTIARSDSKQSWSYQYTTRFVYGAISTATPTLKFRLPYDDGQSHSVGQGYNGSFSHQAGTWANLALDFTMNEGTAVHASQKGYVVKLQKGSTEGGATDYYKDKANYISIVHDEGTVTQYVHLTSAGVLVTLGQKVSTGEKIGLSGNTGFSTGPHLHFHGYRHENFDSAKTLTLSLMTQSGYTISLATGTSYTASPLVRGVRPERALLTMPEAQAGPSGGGGGGEAEE